MDGFKRVATGLLSVIALTLPLAAELPPVLRTAPQVVAGTLDNLVFTTSILLQNPDVLPCPAQILFHQGPGPLPQDLLIDGESQTNPMFLQVGPLTNLTLKVTKESGLFEGAATITDFCGQLQMTAGYELLTGPSPGGRRAPGRYRAF